MNRCAGCGKELQAIDSNMDGYVKESMLNKAEYCERCFKLKYYGQVETKELLINDIELLESIKKEKGRIIYLCDLLNLSPNIKKHVKFLTDDDYIILTKRDALPKSVIDDKLIKYFKDNYKNISKIYVISSYKKINIDKLLNDIKTEKNSKFYIVGNSNSGKSTLINSLLESIGKKGKIVTSRTLNTTLENINIELDNNITLIDTPGFNDISIEKYLTKSQIKKLQIKKELKVNTIQLKSNYSIYIEDILRLDYYGDVTNSFSFYMSNALNLKIKKIIPNGKQKPIILDLKPNMDIVINGLGFIKVTKECKIYLYTFDENLISIRNNLI